MNNCSSKLAYTLPDLINEDSPLEMLFSSRDQWHIIHLTYLQAFILYYLIFYSVIIRKIGIRLKNRLHVGIVIISAIAIIYIWEAFTEPFFCVVGQQAKLIFPSIVNGQNPISSVVREEWFCESHTNSLFDQLHGIIALVVFAVASVINRSEYLWREISKKEMVFYALCWIVSPWVTTLIPIYVHVDTCRPPITSLYDTLGFQPQNYIPLGVWLYFLVQGAFYLFLMWYEPAERSFISKLLLYFSMVLIVNVWQPFGIVVPSLLMVFIYLFFSLLLNKVYEHYVYPVW